MQPLVVDIETAERFDSLDIEVQKYLVDRERQQLQKSGEEADPTENVIASLPLNPAAGTIVSIGMWLVEDKRGLVLVNNQLTADKKLNGSKQFDQQTGVFYGSEAKILEVFWAKVVEKAGYGGRNARYPIITFNGRSFDGPFLMLRSTICGVKPTRNMVGYRYSLQDNCDLLEVLTFMGALSWQHRYSLDFWCHQFGIESPKQDMDGSQVGEVWRSGDLEKLIRYSIADVKATAELYKAVKPLIESQM